MSHIQTLPIEVVHLIAAGEVIDSLAAVVRELAENAIDAKATRIVISIWTDAMSVQLSDNGIGIGIADLSQAATAHTTSKINTTEDLQKINSFIIQIFLLLKKNCTSVLLHCIDFLE